MNKVSWTGLEESQEQLMMLTDHEISPVDDLTFIVDSGASSHMSGNMETFTYLVLLNAPIPGMILF